MGKRLQREDSEADEMKTRLHELVPAAIVGDGSLMALQFDWSSFFDEGCELHKGGRGRKFGRKKTQML